MIYFFPFHSAQKRQTRQSLRSSLSGTFSPGEENTTGASKRRTTASPGAIAFLASMLNNSENNISGSKNDDYSSNFAFAQESVDGIASSSPVAPFRSSLSTDHRISYGGGVMNGSEIGIVFDGASSRITSEATNRRQSILSPGMAALFGLDQPSVNVLNSSMQGTSSSSSAASVAGGGGGAKTGPSHRAKTPARSCMTGGKTGQEKASRRGVIFGSPQAAEFTSDSAVADSLTNMDKSAVKARYKLGNEPELPFPSLYDMDLASSATASAHAHNEPTSSLSDKRTRQFGTLIVAEDDDNGSIASVESIETSKNTAQLAEWEEEVSQMESSASRAKRTRESAKSKNRSSLLDIDSNKEFGGASGGGESSFTSNQPLMATSPRGSVASPESKRSRRSSTMGKRTAELDAVVAQVMVEDEEGQEDIGEKEDVDMSLNEDSFQNERSNKAPSSLFSAAAAPPTPLRRSKRLEGEESTRSIASLDKSALSAGRLMKSSLETEYSTNDMSVVSPSPKPQRTRSTPRRNQEDAQQPQSHVLSTSSSSSTPLLFAASSPISGPVQSLLASQISLKQPQENDLVSSKREVLKSVSGIVKAPIVISKSPDQRQKRSTGVVDGKRRVTLAVVPSLAQGQSHTQSSSLSIPALPRYSSHVNDASLSSSVLDDPDRTADTVERAALFAMLAEEDERTASSSASTSVQMVNSHRNVIPSGVALNRQAPPPLPPSVSTNYDDLTTILGGSASFSSLPSAAAVFNNRVGGGSGGRFGLSAFLEDDITLQRSALNDVTAVLPDSLGSLLASEANVINKGKSNPKSIPIPTSSSSSSSSSSSAVVAYANDQLESANMEFDSDDTFASLDAVPRDEADGSFAPNSPEFSFTAPTPSTSSSSSSLSKKDTLTSIAPRTIYGKTTSSTFIPPTLSQQCPPSSEDQSKATAATTRTPSKNEIQSASISVQKVLTPRTTTVAASITSSSSPSSTSMLRPASILPPSSSSFTRQGHPSSTSQPQNSLALSVHNNITVSPRKTISSPTLVVKSKKDVAMNDILGSASKMKSNNMALQSVSSSSAPFLFEDFCAVAGLRIFSASHQASSTAFDAIVLPEPVLFGTSRDHRAKSSKRRTSSIAQLARQSLINGRGGRKVTMGAVDEDEGDEFTAMAASLITRSVLIPEREQIVGATDVLRKEIANVAPLLAAYVKEIDASPPIAVREIARAQAIVSAFDLEGPSAVSDIELSRAQPLLTRLRELKAMHELNASLVYLQWRADMAKQRLEALSKAKASLLAESTSLEITSDAIRDANQKLESALNALEVKGVKAMQAVEGPLRASVEVAKAEKTALLNIAAQVAPAESERAELASRRAALEAKVKSEESNVALLEAEAEKEKRTDGAYSGESTATAVAIGAQAAKRYESLCLQTGFKVASVEINSSSTSVTTSSSSLATVSLDFIEPDNRVLRLTLLVKASKASFVGLVHLASGEMNESMQHKIWREAGVLEHYRSVSDTLADSLVSAVVEAEARGDPLVGPSLKNRISKLGDGLRRLAALCNEVVTLKESFPCRISRATSTSPWTFSADLAAPAKKLKLRLQLDLDLTVETSYPTRAFKCTLIWVSGEQRLASSAIAHAVHKAQDDFLDGIGASQRSGALKALIRACSQALKAVV